MSQKVSIIVPVYNAEAHLEECVASLRQQTHPALEILLIDDGSTDQSLALCRRFAGEDSRIRVLHHENRGPSATRNRGLAEATGDYIVFSDADDRMEPDAVEAMLAAALDQRAQLVIGAYARFRDGETADFSQHRITPYSMALFFGSRELGLLFAEARTSLAAVSIWAKLYDAGIIRREGITFPEDVNYEEDCCFNLQYYRHVERAVALNRIVYHYRQVSTSLSKSYRPQILEHQLAGYRLRSQFLTEQGAPEALPALKTIMLIVFTTACKRIAISGIKNKADAYAALVNRAEVREIAATGRQPGDRLTKLLTIGFKAGSVPLVRLVMSIWAARQHLKKGSL